MTTLTRERERGVGGPEKERKKKVKEKQKKKMGEEKEKKGEGNRFEVDKPRGWLTLLEMFLFPVLPNSDAKAK